MEKGNVTAHQLPPSSRIHVGKKVLKIYTCLRGAKSQKVICKNVITLYGKMVAYIVWVNCQNSLEKKPQCAVTPSTCNCTQGLTGYSVLSPLVRL